MLYFYNSFKEYLKQIGICLLLLSVVALYSPLPALAQEAAASETRDQILSEVRSNRLSPDTANTSVESPATEEVATEEQPATELPVQTPVVDSQETESQTPEAEPDTSLEEEKKTKPEEPEELPALESSSSEDYTGDQEPTKNTFNLIVDQSTGALVYDYPIDLPPGRSGLNPDLALTYNSQDNEKFNIIGQGWTVNIPYIQRIPRKGVDNLYNETGNQFFYSSLSGELATTTATTTYEAKIDNGSFYQYEFVDEEKWQVTDKNGTIFKFGYSTSSQQYYSTSTYTWLLEEVRDTNDNYIRYEYYHDSGQVYPDKIHYTGHGSTDGIFEVEFLRESRSDIFKRYDMGFEVEIGYRIYEIKVYINGEWVRKYELDYGGGTTILPSRLESVTESGQDEDENTVTLPATEFIYSVTSGSGISGWTNASSTYSIPYNTEFHGNSIDTGFRAADINGDGLDDVINGREDEGRIYYNDGDGGFTDSGYDVPVTFATASGGDTGARLADLNGDGLVDIFVKYNQSYINLDGGENWDTYGGLPDGWQMVLGALALGDVNGDGLVDAMYNNGEYPSSSLNGVYINNGTSGFTKDTDYTLPVYFIHPNGNSNGIVPIDVNADGLVDLAYNTGEDDNVYINQGNGYWSLDSDYSTPFTGWQSVWLTDANRYKLLDEYNLSSGEYNSGIASGSSAWGSLSYPPIQITGLTRLIDLNGDGLNDIVRKSSQVNYIYTSYGIQPGLITGISLSTNASSTIYYKTSPEYRDESDDLLNPDLPINLQTVYQIVQNDGLDNVATTTYEYIGGEYYYENPLVRRLAGFGRVETTDPLGNITKTYYHQGNGTDSSNGEYSDDKSKISRVYRVEQYNDSSNLYRLTTNKWENYDLGYNNDFVKLTQAIDFAYDGDGDHKDKAVTYTYDNDNGNLTERVRWGEVTGSTNGTFTDTGSDKFTTDYAYAASSTAYLVGRLKTETLEDQNSDKVAETKYYYDSLSHGNVAKGNETKREMWVENDGGDVYIDTERTYNSYGLVTQFKDPRDKTTDFTYHQHNLYVATSTNALSQDTEFYYDYSNGKVKRTEDENGGIWETVYDGIDRVKTVEIADVDSPGSTVTKTSYTYTDNSSPRIVQRTNHLNSATSTDTYTYIDGFDRTIQERQEAEAANTFSVKDYAYDENGNLATESLPYFSTGSSKTTATTTSDMLINYDYDALNRLTSRQDAVGTTSRDYDQWQITINDAESNDKDLIYDAYDQLVEVNEHNGGSTYETYYAYNGLGKLATTTDELGNIRSFTYDGLGRRLTTQDLHDSSDNYFGAWSYEYDDAGNLTEETNPNGQVITYTYDDINRVTKEDSDSTWFDDIIYDYDSGCSNGVGRLCASRRINIATTTPDNLIFNGNMESSAALDQGIEDRWGATISAGNDIDYATTTPIYGDQSILVTKNNTTTDTLLVQSIALDGGTEYRFKAVIETSVDVDGTMSLTNYRDGSGGGGWGWQGLYWEEDLEPGQRYIIDETFTPSMSDQDHRVIFQFNFNNVTNGEIKIDSVEVREPEGSSDWYVLWAIYSYDDLGRVSQEHYPMGSSYYTSFEYDRQDNITEVDLPGSNGSKYYYNNAGLVERIETQEDGSSFTNFVDNFDYNPLGQITLQENSNGIIVTNTYDKDELYRLKSKTASSTLMIGPTNIISNESFETGDLTDWSTSGTVNATSTWFYDGDYSAGMTQTSAGNYYDTQLNQIIPIDSTKTYVLSFYAKSTESRTIGVNLLENGGDYTWYGLWYEPTLTTDWAQYSTTFSPNTTDPAALFSIQSGNATATVWIDEVWLYEQGDTGSAVQLQDLTYTYDNVGNITQIVDVSDTDTAKTVSYEYDDLYRLTNATASSTIGSYEQKYTYNSIGNIETSVFNTATSTYSYQGNTGTSYANPHAVTQIVNGVSTTTLEYDRNGNVISDGDWTHVWNYDNRLMEARSDSARIGYGYDYNDQRILVDTTSIRTYYPNKYYNEDDTNSTETIHVWAGDTNLGTVNIGTQFTKRFTNHTDHLGGSSILSLDDETIAQTLDYMPFGSIRLDDKSGSFDEQRKAFGHQYDTDTDLIYMNARYYSPEMGRFMSQDPLHQAIGGDISKYSRPLVDYLANPQSLNSYSYVINNPLMYIDPLGLETKVYIEKGNSDEGLKSIVGHTFVEISRDDNSTVYNWSPNVGYDYHQSDEKYYGTDLEVTDIDTLLSREGKNADSFNVYTFDTSTEQESAIGDYYTNLASQHFGPYGQSSVSFDVLSNNCVDVSIGALQAGGIVSQSFEATTFGISTPGNLRSQLENKYKAQNASNKFTRWWYGTKTNGINMSISNKEIINTMQND